MICSVVIVAPGLGFLTLVVVVSGFAGLAVVTVIVTVVDLTGSVIVPLSYMI